MLLVLTNCLQELPKLSFFFLLLQELQGPDRDNFTSFEKYRFFLVCQKPICLWQELQEQDRDNFTSFQKYRGFFLVCQKPICLWLLRVSSITKQPGHDQANSF